MYYVLKSSLFTKLVFSPAWVNSLPDKTSSHFKRDAAPCLFPFWFNKYVWILGWFTTTRSSAKRIKNCAVQFWPPKEKMIESEIRKYACCTDNLKAAIVFSIITIILDVAAVVLGIIFVSVLYYFFNVAWAIRVILPPLIGIFLIVKDSKLLYGSIKASRGPLIAGAIMEGITFLTFYPEFLTTSSCFLTPTEKNLIPTFLSWNVCPAPSRPFLA